MKDEISVCCYRPGLDGSGIGSIESAMEHLFSDAKSEILITTYSMSSAADIFLDWLEASLAKGILIRIAINKLTEQNPGVVTRMMGLRNSYPHFLFV